ncbi:MAG: hypothetical protein KOO69_06960, partial [Victivallales bacterium]|nr:hypothetical protein [Victivallales bacterium]
YHNKFLFYFNVKKLERSHLFKSSLSSFFKSLALRELYCLKSAVNRLNFAIGDDDQQVRLLDRRGVASAF